jgi:hypothetical protein
MSSTGEGSQETFPKWFVRGLSAVGLVMLSSFAAWMTYVSSQLNSMSRDYVEMKANVVALEKRMEAQTSEDTRRYEQIRSDMRAFVDRMDAKMDKLLSQRIGAVSP